MADAIGNPLEFKQNVVGNDVRQVLFAKTPLRISDDTQMTLFEYEALRHGLKPEEAIRRWYSTQCYVGATTPPYPISLLDFKELYVREAPGSTCIGSALELSNDRPVKNDSKGNGTVMRAAPFAVAGLLNGLDRKTIMRMAKEDALLTHKHPYAWQSSVMLCDILLNLLEGASFVTAVEKACDVPSMYVPCLVWECASDPQALERLRSSRSGWVAEECLAMAVGSVARALIDFKGEGETLYRQAVIEACIGNTTDSDTIAGVAGALAVAAGGVVPEPLKTRLTARSAIQYIIDMYV